jgi:excisionase family DNA binding protein
MSKSVSAAERERRARQRAFSIREFEQAFRLGRTKIYEEIKAGRLRARKVGKRTIITDEDAEEWLERLPSLSSGNSSEVA